MEKKFLKTKRKLISEMDFGKDNKIEFDYFNDYINNIGKKDKIDNKNEYKSFGNERVISVIKREEIITLSTEKLSEFQKFVDCFNCLFYNKDGDKHYLIDPHSVEEFFEESEFHIIYNLDFTNMLQEKVFREVHNVPQRKNIKNIKQFCPFSEWYFNTNDHKYFYTSLWSANRVLKFNRLNDKNYGEYMDPKFEKCSNSRITKFYGPFGTGKSTLVYLFFKTISYVSSSKESDDFTNLDKIICNKNLQELISKKKYKIKIKKDKNKYKSNIEVDKELNFNDSDDESSSDSYMEEKNIELKEKEKNNIFLEKKENKTKKNKHIISLLYEKEYENNDSTEEEFKFLSSFYINLDKEKTIEHSKSNRKYFEYELMNLFKTYKFYQYIISYINSNPKNNIFDRIKQVIDFMKMINNKRNYFIIIDHISESDQNDIIDLENYMLKDPYCYFIELPLIQTVQEKINFLNDYYLSKEENLDCYDHKDEITFIKRNKKYGIVYSTNFYKPIFSQSQDDIEFINNFGENIYYYCLWKFSSENLEINEFIEIYLDKLCAIFKENYNDDEKKLSFNIKTILDIIYEKKEITDTDFITHLPLDYFVLINKNNKYFLEYSFPLIDKVLKKLNISSSIELINSRYFITYFDNFIKGGIMEKVFAEKMKENYLKITNNKLISIDIRRIIDNNIRDFYRYDEENYFLNSNKVFKKIKDENNNLTNKNILFNQAQNAKHYDLGLKLFNQGNKYCFFQVTFHKPDYDVMDLINNMWIDLNYGINKIKNLCDENEEKIIGIYVFFVLMDLDSYDIKDKTQEENEIINENKKYNEELIKKLNQYKIDHLFLDSKGNITKDSQIIREIPLKLNLINKFNNKIKSLSNDKSNLEDQFTDYFQKLFPKKNIELLYYNPLIAKKLKQNRILFHLFKDYKNNYFELVKENHLHYYNMNNNEISADTVRKIEIDNKKNWKMNMFFRIND